MKDARLTGSFARPKLSPRLTLQHRIPWCTLISPMINCCIENRRKGTFDKDETVKYRNQRCDWLYWLSWIRIMPQRNKVLADRSRLTAALTDLHFTSIIPLPLRFSCLRKLSHRRTRVRQSKCHHLAADYHPVRGFTHLLVGASREVRFCFCSQMDITTIRVES